MTPVANIYSRVTKLSSRAVSIYLLYKDEKPSVWSVRPRRAHNFAVSRHVDSGLARNESHVFWHQQVCYEKFLTAAVFLLWPYERCNVEDFC